MTTQKKSKPSKRVQALAEKLLIAMVRKRPFTLQTDPDTYKASVRGAFNYAKAFYEVQDE